MFAPRVLRKKLLRALPMEHASTSARPQLRTAAHFPNVQLFLKHAGSYGVGRFWMWQRAFSAGSKQRMADTETSGNSGRPMNTADEPGAREPSEPLEPEGSELIFLTDGIGMIDVFNMPPQHFILGVTLYGLTWRLPDQWSMRDFRAGGAQVVCTLFERAATAAEKNAFAPFADLVTAGLVEGALAAKLSADSELWQKEGWAEKPVLKSALILGLLRIEAFECNEDGDGGVDNEKAAIHGEKRIRVTPLVYTEELYRYIRVAKSYTIWRLQSWTFERGLHESQWRVVDTSLSNWYWRRPTGNISKSAGDVAN